MDFCILKILDMKNRAFRPKMADTLLKEMLQSFPAILVQGPKWCGKTTTAGM